MAWNARPRRETPRGLATLFVLLTITSSFATVALPGVGAVVTEQVTIDNPSNHFLVGLTSPYTVRWGYSGFGNANQNGQCHLTIYDNDTTPPQPLAGYSDVVSDCTGDTGHGNASWILQSNQQMNVSIEMHVEGSATTGVTTGTKTAWVTGQVDTKAPVLKHALATQASGVSAISLASTPVASPTSSGTVNGTDAVQVAVHDLTLQTVTALVAPAGKDPRTAGNPITMTQVGSTPTWSFDFSQVHSVAGFKLWNGRAFSVVFVATDGAGHTTTGPAPGNVYALTYDGQAPTVTSNIALASADHQYVDGFGATWVAGTFDVNTTAADNLSSIAGVQFLGGSGSLPMLEATGAVQPDGSWQGTFDSIFLPSGRVSVYTTVTDDPGNVGRNSIAQELVLNVDNDRPIAAALVTPAPAKLTVDTSTPTLTWHLTDGLGVGVDTASFTAMIGTHPLTIDAANFTANGTGYDVSYTVPAAMDLANTTYKVTAAYQDLLGNVAHKGRTNITINDAPPTIASDTAVSGSPNVQQHGTLSVLVDATDASGLGSVVLRLQNSDGTFAKAVGSSKTWAYTALSHKAPSFTTLNRVITVTDTGSNSSGAMPLGNYTLNLTVTDVHGHVSTLDLGKVSVGPTVVLHGDANLAHDILYANLTAGITTSTTPLQSTCVSGDRCDLSRLIVQYSDSSSHWQTLTVRRVQDGFNATGFAYYNLSLDVSGVSGFTGSLRFIGNVSYGKAPSQNYQTYVHAIATGPGTTVIHVVRPVVGDVNGTGDVSLAVRVNQLPLGLPASDAMIKVDLQNDLTHTTVSCTHATLKAPSSSDGTGLWTRQVNATSCHGAPLARGVYTVTFDLVNANSPSVSVYRMKPVTFRVETRAPTVHILASTFPNVGSPRWVGNTIHLHLLVNTGYANLPSFGSMVVNFDSNGGGWSVTPSSVVWKDGNASLAGVDLPSPGNLTTGPHVYQLNATVAVDPAIGSQPFYLYVNATNDANDTKTGPPDGQAGFANVLVKLDTTSPTVALTRTHEAALNFTTWNASIARTSNPYLSVNVSDTGAGAGTVNATFYKLSNGVLEPYVGQSASTWSSDPTATPVYVSGSAMSNGMWKIADTSDGVLTEMHNEPVMTQPNTTAYYVKLDVHDAVGNERVTGLIPVSADVGPPYVTPLNLAFVKADASLTRHVQTVNWGLADPTIDERSNPNQPQPGVISVHAALTEDVGLASVQLRILQPDGAVETVSGTVPTASQCANKATRSSYATTPCVARWNVTGANLSQVGNYRVALVATDLSGQSRTTLNATDGTPYLLNFTVRDTIAPRLSHAGFQPAHPSPGTVVLATVNALDDAGIQNASILWYRNNDTGVAESHGPFAMTCTPITGETNADQCQATSEGHHLNLTPGYVWWGKMSVQDVNGKVSHTTPYFTVTNNSAPVVRVLAPGPGVTWLNATPQVRIDVADTNLDVASVTVRTGPDTGNLTTVQVPLTADPNGYDHRGTVPTGTLADGSSWVLNVTAQDTFGLKAGIQRTFQVDAGAPTVTATLAGNVTAPDGTNWVPGDATLTLVPTDAGSGIQDLNYTIGSGASTKYDGPIAFSSAPAGPVTVTWTATDVAGNVATGSLSVSVDHTGPSITVNQQGRNVSATVTDAGIGVDAGNVTLYYALSGSSTFAAVPMTHGVGNLWHGSIPSNIQGNVVYYLAAKDLLGNVGTYGSANAPKPLTTSNHPPALQVTAPAAGSVLETSTTVAWKATDSDGDALNVSILLQPASGAATTLASNLAAQGQRKVDLTGMQEGSYTLVVVANDGTTNTSRSVDVSVLGHRLVVPASSEPSNTTAGQSVPISVKVDNPLRTVVAVNATILRDGKTAGQVPLHSAGGTAWSGSYTPTAAGAYKVLVVVTYSDGTQSAAYQVASWDAAASPASSFPTAILVLALLGAAVVALGGYAAFGRWRR